ncbi:hypothetical protein F503_00563 [Ophiostoma piceae UAMH 11346]|uniref:Uncharacterized protein n=1 Tax=Ophiostoma piceae (strain UAMH 11346) TaxID=1262450 RepID=S3C7D0_OPHP1|nr:hypothetical protein F503_00563 [Ophiostoma piceae UAMH 11346]
MIVLESLQMAQMVADLSELEAARNERARALLQANKEAEAAAAAAAAAAASAPATPADDPSRPSMHHRGASAASVFSSSSANGTASPFDSYLGRFLSPALTRTNSSHGTGLNTPQSQTQNSSHTADVDRASSMVALHELRAKLKQYNDSASLRQAREKVAALSAHRQAGEQAAPTSDPAPSQQPPLARRNSQFTFPRE